MCFLQRADYLTDFDRAMEHCSHTPRNNANFQALQRCAPLISNLAAFHSCVAGLNAQAKAIINASVLACVDKYTTAAKAAGGTSDSKKGRLASQDQRGVKRRVGIGKK